MKLSSVCLAPTRLPLQSPHFFPCLEGVFLSQPPQPSLSHLLSNLTSRLQRLKSRWPTPEREMLVDAGFVFLETGRWAEAGARAGEGVRSWLEDVTCPPFTPAPLPGFLLPGATRSQHRG